MKKCPYCAEEIQDEAIVCKHCGRDLKFGSPFPPAWEAEAKALTAQGEFIEAIKLVRESTGLGLAEAKAKVDGWRGSSPIVEPVQRSAAGCIVALLLFFGLLAVGLFVLFRS